MFIPKEEMQQKVLKVQHMIEISMLNHWPPAVSDEIIKLLSERLSDFESLRLNALESTKLFFIDMVRELAIESGASQSFVAKGEEAWLQFFDEIESFYPVPGHRRRFYERPLIMLIIYLGIRFGEWLLVYLKQRSSSRFWRKAHVRMTEFLKELCSEIQANFKNITPPQISDLQDFMRSYIQPE